jgi:hypothetical protein
LLKKRLTFLDQQQAADRAKALEQRLASKSSGCSPKTRSRSRSRRRNSR